MIADVQLVSELFEWVSCVSVSGAGPWPWHNDTRDQVCVPTPPDTDHQLLPNVPSNRFQAVSKQIIMSKLSRS